MATKRMKLDYNHLIEQVSLVIAKSRSKMARECGFGLEMGLNMLTEYIKLIALRAIEIQDEKLLDILLDMMVVKETSNETEKGGAE